MKVINVCALAVLFTLCLTSVVLGKQLAEKQGEGQAVLQAVHDEEDARLVREAEWSKFEAVSKLLAKYNILGKDSTSVTYEAAVKLSKADTTKADNPASVLETLGTFLKYGSKLVPKPLGHVKGFLKAYGKALVEISGALGKISANIRASEAGVAILHPGSWPGGFSLYNNLVKVCKGEKPEIGRFSDTHKFILAHREELHWATGTDPVETTFMIAHIDREIKFLQDNYDAVALAAYNTWPVADSPDGLIYSLCSKKSNNDLYYVPPF